MRRNIVICITALAAVMIGSSSFAQNIIYSENDTASVADAAAQPGQSTDVFLNMANPSFRIDGYDVRLAYDETLLSVDTVYCQDQGCNLEAFSADFSTPGEIHFLVTSWTGGFIPRGSGPIAVMRFVVLDSAQPGSITSIDFNSILPSDNLWGDSLGLNLWRPILVDGNFSITGGGFNQPPVISNIGNQSVAEGQILSFNVVAHDPDADPITLYAESLPENATFPQVQGDSLVTSLFTFQPDFTQGPDTFHVTFVVNDDHNNITTRPVQIVVFDQPNDIISIVSSQGGIPGAIDRPVGVEMFNAVPVYGVQFETIYDPDQINILEVLPTPRINNMMFNFNQPTPGRIIVLIFSIGTDVVQPGDGPLVDFVVDVNPLARFGPTDISMLNAIETLDSLTSKEFEVEDGYFTVDQFGDANLDASVDVGDCVSIVSYIIGQLDFSLRMFEAADYDSTGRVDIGDLQDIVNFILELPVGPGSSPLDPPSYVEIMTDNIPSGDMIDVPIWAEMNSNASAAQFEIQYNSDHLEVVDLSLGNMASNMFLEYNIEAGLIKGAIFNFGGDSFGLETGELVNIEFRMLDSNLNTANDVSLVDFKLVNPAADFISVEILGLLPAEFTLNQNYPNPFNASTTISFNLPAAADVELAVYDLLGRKINTLLKGFKQAGRHDLIWNGRSDSGEDVASGVFFYRLKTKDFDKTKKMLLVK